MTSPTKPIHEFFNQQRYLRHKHKLATIDSERPKPTAFDPLSSMHRLRHQSVVFHNQQHEDHISTQNEKLLQKLLQISKRKKSIYNSCNQVPKIVSFQNPARKKREKMITEMNQQMADRLLAKQSHLDHKVMRRSMEEYQKIKQTMVNNKRVLTVANPIRPSLPMLSKKKQQNLSQSQRKRITISYEEELGDNPQYFDKQEKYPQTKF